MQAVIIVSLSVVIVALIVAEVIWLRPMLRDLKVISGMVFRLQRLEEQAEENCVAVDAITGSLSDTPEMLAKRRDGVYTAVIPRDEARRAGLEPKRSAHA